MKLAIVVGHTQASPGAQAVEPIADNEYSYNSEVAASIYREARENDLECQIFYRDKCGVDGAYRAVEIWAKDDVACAIELHFNAADRKARGTETLYDSVPLSSKRLAEIVQSEVCGVFQRTGKGNRGAKLTDQGRGAHNLAACLLPSCLVEPFFGDNADDAALGDRLKWKYARSLVAAVMAFRKELN